MPRKVQLEYARILATTLRSTSAVAPSMADIVRECRIVRAEYYKRGLHKKQYR